MVPFECICTKWLLTLFHMYTDKLSKSILIIWLNFLSLNHEEPPNGRFLPSLFPKNGWIWQITDLCFLNKLLYANNTPYQSSQIYWITSLGINTSSNLTFPCNTLRLSLMSQTKTYLLLLSCWQVQIQMTSHGTQMWSWLCSTSYWGGPMGCQLQWCLSWQH